jgi:hypothetical protein
MSWWRDGVNFRFQDVGDDTLVVSETFGQIRLDWDEDGGIEDFQFGRDDARMLGRIFLRYADHGTIEGADEPDPVRGLPKAEQTPAGDRVAAMQDLIDDLEVRLTTAERKSREEFAKVGRQIADAGRASSRHWDLLNDHGALLDMTRDQANAHARQLAEIRERLDVVEDRLTTAERDARETSDVHRSAINNHVGRIESLERRGAELEASVRSQRDRLDAVDQQVGDHEEQLFAFRGRLGAIEERQPDVKARPEAYTTPQQDADAMASRFPVGTRVKYRLMNGENLWDDGGMIAGPFLFDGNGKYVVQVHGPFCMHLATHVEPAE